MAYTPGIITTIVLPRELHARMKRVTKRVRMAATEVIRRGLAEQLDSIEARLEQDERKRCAEEAEKKNKRGIGRSSLAPNPAPLVEEQVEAEPSPLDKIYAEHGRKIFEALDNPYEKRIRLHEAIRAVKSFAPLTHPPEGAILVMLEREVVKLRAAGPQFDNLRDRRAPKPPQPAEPDVLIDPDRVQTHGDV